MGDVWASHIGTNTELDPFFLFVNELVCVYADECQIKLAIRSMNDNVDLAE